jgi:hypothetical protein
MNIRIDTYMLLNVLASQYTGQAAENKTGNGQTWDRCKEIPKDEMIVLLASWMQ